MYRPLLTLIPLTMLALALSVTKQSDSCLICISPAFAEYSAADYSAWGPEDEIEEEVEDEVEEEIEDEVEEEIEDEVEEEIEDEVEEEIEDEVKEEIEDEVEEEIEDEVEEEIEDEVEEEIEDEVEEEIEDEVEEEIEDEVEEEIEDEVEEEIEDEVEEEIEDEVEEEIEDEVEEEIEDEVEEEIEDEVEEEIEDEVEEEIEDEVEEEIENEVEEEVEEETEEEIEGDVEDETEEEAEEEIEENTDYNIEKEIENNTSTDTTPTPRKANTPPLNNSALPTSTEKLAEKIFENDFDNAGNVIEKGEWVLIAEPSAIDLPALQAYTLKSEESLEGLDLTILRLEAPPSRSIDEVAQELSTLLPDAALDYNHVYEIQSSAPPTHSQGAMPFDQLNFPKMVQSKPYKIGLIDTEINTEHEAFKSSTITQKDFVAYEQIRPKSHGTSTASILIGQSSDYKGLLPGAHLYAASVFFQNPETGNVATTTSLVQALNWFVSENVRVINMSLAGPKNTVLEAALKRGAQKGATIIAAVGNDGPAAAPLYPAAFDNVIAVTAIDVERKVYRLANRGEHIDFSAPGVNILSASETGGYAPQTGTSIAAPFVTATIVHFCHENACDKAELLPALQTQAIDLGAPGHDPIYGFGFIQALSGSTPATP